MYDLNRHYLFDACMLVAAMLLYPGSALPQTPIGTPQSQSASQLKPDSVINAGNLQDHDRYLPEAAKFALKRGFTMTVRPSRRLEWSAGFARATEKYSSQATLDSNDHLVNYVAGMPFPLVTVDDPKAAVKIAYNWHMGPFMPDDFFLTPWSSNGYVPDPQNPARWQHKDDSDYACDEFTFLRFAHRTEKDPRPTIGEDAMGFEWKARCKAWIAPEGGDTGEGAGIWVRFLEPSRNDEFYGFSERSRRLRRNAVTGYPNAACRGCHQPFWAYALPKTESYNYRLLGTTTLLACLSAEREPAGITPAENGFSMTEEPFELRNAYILETAPPSTAGDSHNLRSIIYIDSEIYVWLAAEFYEGNERTGVAMPLWRMHPSSEGGNLFDLAGSFYIPTEGTLLRSLVPAHGGFKQVINAGDVSESAFSPAMLAR